MSEKVAAAQAFIDGEKVARMIMEFQREFRGVYPNDVMGSMLCAVGPLQSMIGLAIKNGHLFVGVTEAELLADIDRLRVDADAQRESISRHNISTGDPRLD